MHGLPLSCAREANRAPHRLTADSWLKRSGNVLSFYASACKETASAFNRKRSDGQFCFDCPAWPVHASLPLRLLRLRRTSTSGASAAPSAPRYWIRNVLTTLAEVRRMSQDWQRRYDHGRPHHSLGDLWPIRYAMASSPPSTSIHRMTRKYEEPSGRESLNGMWRGGDVTPLLGAWKSPASCIDGSPQKPPLSRRPVQAPTPV